MKIEQPLSSQAEAALARGDVLVNQGDFAGAAHAYLAGTESDHIPAALCLALARVYVRLKNPSEAVRWAVAVVDACDDFPSWLAAATLIENAKAANAIAPRRRCRVAILGSFTTVQLARILPLSALRQGVELTVWEAPYNQYRQELLDPRSALYATQPDFIILAVHEGDLTLPFLSETPSEHVAQEIARWTGLWDAAARHSSARLVQFNFATPPEAPMGHLGARLMGSRYAMAQAVNAGLGAVAGTNVRILDCERLSAQVGKRQWFDPRYWHLSRQAVSLLALPLLARHVTAIIAADLGLTRKCLVLDLDNTLWGGIIGEDGLNGIKLGGDHLGEEFVAFQESIRLLKQKGVVLAVCSKNNDADAREPFERHPEMRLKLDDFAAFVANWDPKPENLKRIAQTLNIGLDALVFVDDNPVECAAVRRALPEIDVIALPPDPSHYARTLLDYLGFESTSFTGDDTRRTEQYRARSLAARLEQSAGSVEEFWTSSNMAAVIAPFDEVNLPRIVQLIGKTNQFNLTTRRYGPAQVAALMQDPGCVHFWIRLYDRFADYGLVGLLIARQHDSVMEIDTWLMSCRVIGRSVEKTMLAHLSRLVALRGITRIRGLYIPTAKNGLVNDLYSKFGFTRSGDADGGEVWDYDLAASGPIENPFIKITTLGGETNGYPSTSGASIQGCVQR
jgi:FkbH-like protein